MNQEVITLGTREFKKKSIHMTVRVRLTKRLRFRLWILKRLLKVVGFFIEFLTADIAEVEYICEDLG